MRVVIVSNYRIGNETGVANISEKLSVNLAKRHQVLYLCLGKRNEVVRVGKNLKFLKIESVPVKQGFVPKLNYKTVNWINERLNKFSPDIVHSQNIVFVSLVCLIWCKKNNVPFATTFHSLPSEGITWFYPKLSGKKSAEVLNYTLKSGYVKKFMQNVDLIFALNKHVKRSILSTYKDAKIVKLNNGLDLARFKKAKAKSIKKPYKFYYVGSYIPKKNQEFLIRAFRHLSEDYQLHLIGNKVTGKEYVEKLEMLIKKYKTKNIFIHDFVKNDKLPQKVSEYDFFVSASLKEVQSLVVIEALAAGKPVIALKNETVIDLITNKNGLAISTKTTPKNFAQKLKQYVEANLKDYRQLSENCTQSVKEFDIKSVIGHLEENYQKAIESKTKEKQDHGKLIKLVPKNFRNMLLPNLPQKGVARLNYFLVLTMIFSLVTWPILKVLRVLKRD